MPHLGFHRRGVIPSGIRFHALRGFRKRRSTLTRGPLWGGAALVCHRRGSFGTSPLTVARPKTPVWASATYKSRDGGDFESFSRISYAPLPDTHSHVLVTRMLGCELNHEVSSLGRKT